MPSAQLQSLLQKKDLVYDLILLGLVFQLDLSPSSPKAPLKENLRKVLSHSPKLANSRSLCPHPSPSGSLLTKKTALRSSFQRWPPKAAGLVWGATRMAGSTYVPPWSHTLGTHLHFPSLSPASMLSFPHFPSSLLSPKPPSCLHPLSASHQRLPGLRLSKMVNASSPLPWARQAAVMLSTPTKESVCL